MPLLRKTGVRSPWQPQPLQAPIEMLRPMVLVSAIVPAVLLGGNTSFVGRPAISENVNWPARPAEVVQIDRPLPGASAIWLSRPLFEVPPATDRVNPTSLIPGQQPIPAAQVQLGSPARLPNVDPLRSTTLISGQQPVPVGQVQLGAAARLPNDDRLRPILVVSDQPDSTLAQPGTLWLSRPLSELIVAPDRLSPTGVQTNQPPVPLGSTQWVGRITATPTDRLALGLQITGAVAQPPGAQAIWLRVPRVPSRLPIGTAVVTPSLPVPAAQPMWVGRVIATPAIRLPIHSVVVVRAREPLPPQVEIQVWTRPLSSLVPDFTVYIAATIKGPGLSGIVASPDIQGELKGPGLPGEVASPGIQGAIRSSSTNESIED